VVDRAVLPVEALPTGAGGAVPEETVVRALVFAAGELQEVLGRDVAVLVDGLDDTRERVAELGVVRQGEALAQQGRGERSCGHRVGVEGGRREG